MYNLTHLHPWQFFTLAARLEHPMTRPERAGRTLKHDHFHRLFFCLKWLNDGNFYRTRETETGWGKSSLHEDTSHILRAIVEGLDGELQWPDEERRRELSSVFPGIFRGCIGVSDVKEYQVVKYKDCERERRTWSGRKKLIVTSFYQ